MIRRPPRSTRLTHSFPTRRSSDLCLIASRSEGGPRAALEAPASGCKVLSSRVGLTPDLLPDACLFDDAFDAARRIAADAAEGCLAKSSAAAHRAAAEQIGRASCRDRVWQ